MENASKALIIAGAILLSILIIAIGMYIYTSSQSTITDSMTSMTTQEINAFNSNFTTYQGVQTGSQVRAMLTYCSGNAKTYEDEENKVPTVKSNRLTVNEINNAAGYSASFKNGSGNETMLTTYVQALSQMSNNLELKHSYRVVLTQGASGMVELITINYDKNDTSANN